MSKPFLFKQFALIQENSAQKMSTDSMVLGAIAEQEDAMNVLDIGTGTGVLALMMAQKHPEAIVDAVEKDEASAQEAALNFENSPWAYRLTAYAQDFLKFIEDETLHYDLIVSNPPYFEKIETEKSNHQDWPEERRRDARTSSGLSFEDLIQGVARVLVNYGRFYVVLPAEQQERFIQLAKEKEMQLIQQVNIRHQANTPIHRVVLAFSKQEQELKMEELVLKNADNSPTEEYKKQTADFHLEF